MVQATEYPWNGIVVTEPLPVGGLGAFVDAPARGIERVRVLLDPRVVMPLGGTDPLPNLTSTTIFGAPPNTAQSAHAREIVQICYDRVALGDSTRRRRAAVLSLACALVETGILIYANPNVPNSAIPPKDATSDGTNGLSVGIFQQQVGPGFQKSNSLADVTEVMSVPGGTNLWLDRLSAQASWWVDSGNAAAGTLIQTAQGSGAAALYQAQMPAAELLVTEIQWPPQAPPAVGGGVIPPSIQAQILEIADGAVISSPYPVNVGIEWCLDATQWPTSATAGRRPRVADLTTFWGAMNTLVGAHAGTWGFSLLNNPTFTDTAAANADPHASMTAYAGVTWSGGTDPSLADHQVACRWLETLTAQVRAALRTAGFTKAIAVPTMYAPGHLRDIALFHPNGPWINDSSVWYETSFFPAALDETQVRSSYATYNAWASALGLGYRSSWLESAYFTGGGPSVIDPEPLPAPPQEALGADPNASQVTAPSSPTITSVIVGPASLRVLWDPPSNDGGSEVTGYTVVLNSGTVDNFYPAAISSTGLTIDGLINDLAYAVSVTATNIAGTGQASAVVTATPLASAPPIDVPPPGGPVDPPAPVHVDAPSIIAFYPEGVSGSDGYFVPTNWAGQ